MRKQTYTKVFFLLVGLLSLGLFLLPSRPALAANPATINFQGKIVNFSGGTNVSDGNYSIVFRIYNTATPTPTTACGSDATCLFEETQGTVAVTSGVFQVELGSTCAGGLVASNACTKSVAGGINFNTNSALYLTMQFAGDSSGSHGGFMWPVIHMTTVPYAYNADNLGGLASSAFAQLAQAAAFTSSVSVQPATNIASMTVKQNSNGSPTADILDIQTQNSTGVITVTGPALNEAAVTITSVGATRDLTLGSASGIIKFSAATTTLQKAASAFTLDVSNGASNSTLTIANSGGAGNVTLQLDSGGTYAVGASNGSTISACSSSQFISSQAVTGGIVTGGSCTNAVTSLASAYNSAGTAGNTIGLTSTGAAVLIQDNSSPIGGNLFAVQKNGGTVTYLGVTATGINIQSNATGSAVNALAFDTTTTQPHLKIYGANGTNYADIYYDSGTSTAYYGANTGTAVLGSGTGPVNVTAGAGAAVTITANAASTWSTSAGNLTLDSGGGTLVLGSNTTSLQKAATALSLDVNNASNSTLTVTNTGAGNITLALESGGTYAVGATNGVGISACSSGQYVNTFASVGGIVTGGSCANVSAQTTLQNAYDNSGSPATITTSATAKGVLVKAGATFDSTSLFGIQNSSSISLFNVDSASNNSNNLLTNPSIETGGTPPTGWTAKIVAGGSAVTQISSPYYDGGHSMQIVTSGTATNNGVTQSYALSTSATYVLSVYVNSLSGFVSTAGAGTFDMGFGTSGVDTSCLTAQKVPAASWTRFTCSFTTPGSLTTPYIYFKQTDATPRTFFIDSAVLETDTNATTKWQDGKITLDGTIVSPVIIQPLQDSTNTFLVQNSEGINVFGVDTTDTNLVANPGIEINTTGWSIEGNAGVVYSRDTGNSYLGYAGLKVVTTAHAQDGAKYTFSPNTLIQASTTYAMSFYAKISTAGINTLTFGRSENGAETACVTTGALTTNWSRFSCSFTVGGTIGASPYIYIDQGTTATVQTIWIDAVSLEPGSTASPYGSSSIYLNGVITSPTNFQNKTNSTTAFQVQNSAGDSLIGLDTANTILNLGETGSVATASTVNIASSSGAIQTVTIGGTTTSSATNILGGVSGSINLGSVGSSTLSSAIHIQDTNNATGTQTAVIGNSNNVNNAVTLEAGNTGKIQIGNGTTAHTIQIGAGGAAGGNAQAVTIGSPTTSVNSKVVLQGGNIANSSGVAGIEIGNPTTDTNLVPFQLDSDSNFSSDENNGVNCTTTINQGSMYYNTTSNAIRACVNAVWEDVVSTASLGLQLFGVVPDTGTNPGDLAGVTGLPNGPCKVSEGGTTSTVSWTGCTAFSGGRKVIVTAGTTTTAAGTSATIIFQHLCLTAANNQPALSGIAIETANLSTVSMPGVTNPILCLADIKVTNGSNVITAIYNTSTYTTTDKEFASAITTAPILGSIVTQGATTPGAVAIGTALQAGSVVGVIVATTGAISTNTINAIVAINGPAWVKAITETGNAVGNTIQTTATPGYAGAFSGPVVTNVFSVLGLARTAWTSTCAINTLNCNSAVLTNVTPR